MKLKIKTHKVTELVETVTEPVETVTEPVEVKRLLIFLLVCVLNIQAAVAQSYEKKVIAYYSGSLEDLDRYDATKITHIIYCFGHLSGNQIKIGSSRDTLMVQKMVGLKTRNPSLKVLLSLGGWGGCAPCSDVFNSVKGRKDFALSVKSLNAYLGADGIDLDWEYPTIPGYPEHTYRSEDKANFTALLTELRSILGKDQIISFAAGGFDQYIDESVDWDAVMKVVDFVNLMTYDLVSGYATTTGHHTALYSTKEQKQSTDNAVQKLLRKGIDPHQLIIGAAFYARTWEHVPNVNKGLYQPGKFKSFISFKSFPKNLPGALSDSKANKSKTGFVEYWDKHAKAPYAYNADQQIYATYDNKRSIKVKTKYLTKHDLGGIMFWELSSDTYTDGLLETIHQTLHP